MAPAATGVVRNASSCGRRYLRRHRECRSARAAAGAQDDHDGRYVIGTDIAPGVYSSAGPVGSGGCYWARLSSLDGSDIIDSAMSSKPQVVEIQTSDRVFKMDGCQPWRKTDSVSAQGENTGEIPASAAEAQLHTYVDSLNTAARQLVGEQLPRP
jgi:hypothetical protein